MFTLEKITDLLARSKRKLIWVSLLVIFTGALFLIPIFTGDNKVVYWVFASIFIALGLFILIRSASELSRIQNGQLPLLKALKEGDSTFVTWLYVQQINTKAYGAQVGQSHNVVVCDRLGKQQIFVLNRKVDPEPVMEFLYASFPGALIGYSKENAATYDELKRKK